MELASVSAIIGACVSVATAIASKCDEAAEARRTLRETGRMMRNTAQLLERIPEHVASESHVQGILNDMRNEMGNIGSTIDRAVGMSYPRYCLNSKGFSKSVSRSREIIHFLLSCLGVAQSAQTVNSERLNDAANEDFRMLEDIFRINETGLRRARLQEMAALDERDEARAILETIREERDDDSALIRQLLGSLERFDQTGENIPNWCICPFSLEPIAIPVLPDCPDPACGMVCDESSLTQWLQSNDHDGHYNCPFCQQELSSPGMKRIPALREAIYEAMNRTKNDMLERVRSCREIQEFVAMYDSNGFQELLESLHSAQGGTDPVVWAEEWARRMRRNDDVTAMTLNTARKTCLELLYTLCNRWKVDEPPSVKERDIIVTFRDRRVANILQVCLVMDRAQALYKMKYPGSELYGMHWVSQRQMNGNRYFRKAVNAAGGKPTINKRLEWLVDLEELGLDRNEAIMRWMEPQEAPYIG